MPKEVSKGFKILVIISMVGLFILGSLYSFIPEIYWEWVHWPYQDPVFYRLFGGTLIAGGIAMIFVLREKEWKKIRLFVIFIIVWLSIISIVNVWSIIAIPFSEQAISDVIFDTIMTFLLDAGYIYFFILHERKK